MKQQQQRRRPKQIPKPPLRAKKSAPVVVVVPAVAHGATTPRGKGSQILECDPVGIEDTVTLSPVSSPSSPTMECASPSLSSPQFPECGRATLVPHALETAAAAPLSPSSSVTASPSAECIKNAAEITSKASQIPFDAHRSEKLLYYLEVLRLLRHVSAGIEAREQFVHEELRSQTAIREEKWAELAAKKASHQLLRESTLRLSRQVRGMDSENDRMRDQITQLQTAIEKVLSRRPPRRTHQMKLPSRNDGRIGAQRQRLAFANNNDNNDGVIVSKGHNNNNNNNNSKSGRANTILQGPFTPARDVLLMELDACRRKLKTAEAQHEKLLHELQLAAARRRGRAAAFCSFATSVATRGHVESTKLAGSPHPAASDEASVIQELERMIDRNLVRCK